MQPAVINMQEAMLVRLQIQMQILDTEVRAPFTLCDIFQKKASMESLTSSEHCEAARRTTTNHLPHIHMCNVRYIIHLSSISTDLLSLVRLPIRYNLSACDLCDGCYVDYLIIDYLVKLVQL